MKKGRDAGFSSKRSGNAGSGSPLPDPDLTTHSFVNSFTHSLILSFNHSFLFIYLFIYLFICIALHCIASQHIVSYRIVLYCSVLYCIVLYCIELYCSCICIMGRTTYYYLQISSPLQYRIKFLRL